MRESYLKKDYPQFVFAIKRTKPKGKKLYRRKVLPKVLRPVKMFKENDSSKPKINISETNKNPILGEFEQITRLSKGPKIVGSTKITTTLTNQLNTHTFMIGLRVDPSGQFTTSIFIKLGLITNQNDTKEEVFSITGECFIASIAASATGKHVIAVSSKGALYKTENYGQHGSWTIDDQLKGHTCKQVIINSEGQYVLVLTTNKLYISNDYGQTFTKALELDNKIWFTSVSLDEENTDINKPMKISIQTNKAQIYLSEDMGSTFIANT